MTVDAQISPELFQFLSELRENNNREWFLANKRRYESYVRQPLLRFIADFGVHLSKISQHYLADPRPLGGSLFRIYRDVRFSKDKSPYKTSAGIHFRHERAKDVHTPGFYLHLEPGNVSGGVGIWHPDTSTLTKIRDTIVDDPSSWKRVLSDNDFKSTFRLKGDSLKRAPTGFDPDHQLIEDLKRKDFIASAALSEEDACKPDFIDQFGKVCSDATSFMRFLTSAIGLPW
ncbi:MAG: DUF2461 domain-containing protein [Candidatus Neomarinimicrobiota bacterium]